MGACNASTVGSPRTSSEIREESTTPSRFANSEMDVDHTRYTSTVKLELAVRILASRTSHRQRSADRRQSVHSAQHVAHTINRTWCCNAASQQNAGYRLHFNEVGRPLNVCLQLHHVRLKHVQDLIVRCMFLSTMIVQQAFAWTLWHSDCRTSSTSRSANVVGHQFWIAPVITLKIRGSLQRSNGETSKNSV